MPGLCTTGSLPGALFLLRSHPGAPLTEPAHDSIGYHSVTGFSTSPCNHTNDKLHYLPKRHLGGSQIKTAWQALYLSRIKRVYRNRISFWLRLIRSQDGIMLLDVHRVSSPTAKASILYFSNYISPVYGTDEASPLTSLFSLPNSLVFGKGAGFTLLSKVIVHPPSSDGKNLGP